MVLTRGSMNLSQRDGGLPPDAVVQDADTILADSKRLIDRYHQRADDAMVQIALAPCSPFSVTTALMRSTAELAAQENVRLHTHLAETEDENRFCQELYGCRPLDYLDNCGWLGERTWLAHGVHFNSDEIRRLALARTAVSHCACSNQDAGVGLLPGLRHGGRRHARRPGRRRLGVQRCLQSHAGGARRVPAAARPLRRQQGQPPRRIALGDLGLGGVHRRPTLGEIKERKEADLAFFKLDELRFSGHGDPLAALVLCGAHKADRMMVGGRWVVEDGRIPGLDLDDLIRRHSAAALLLQNSVSARP